MAAHTRGKNHKRRLVNTVQRSCNSAIYYLHLVTRADGSFIQIESAYCAKNLIPRKPLKPLSDWELITAREVKSLWSTWPIKPATSLSRPNCIYMNECQCYQECGCTFLREEALWQTSSEVALAAIPLAMLEKPLLPISPNT